MSAELTGRLAEIRDEAPTVTRCTRCKRWKHRGTAAEGRAAFADHLREKHGVE